MSAYDHYDDPAVDEDEIDGDVMDSTPTRFDMRHPCPGCPFRLNGRPVLLSRDRREDVADGLRAQKTFACHETLYGDRAGEPVQCAGAMIIMTREGLPGPQLARIFDRLGTKVEWGDDDDGEHVPWGSLDEWVEDMPDVDDPRRDRKPGRGGSCGYRHWFAYYGMPGSSAPTCIRVGCDAPNPRYDRDRDPHA